MKRAILFHLDGKLPNIALMRLSQSLKERDWDVLFRRTGRPERTLFEIAEPDAVFASTIFRSTKPAVDSLLRAYPSACVGGTGYSVSSSLESIGVLTTKQDYSLYPNFQSSIGFTQRGCRLKCTFCVVPEKEGKIRAAESVNEIWRGGSHPKELLLLDNDFFGQPEWRERISSIRDGGFKVSFSQGINARCVTDETAEAVASVEYRDDQMKTKRIYTAWDNRADEKRLFAGLNRLVKYGVKPDHIMVFMLIGYWPGETAGDRDYRRKKLRDFGARPYPMPFVRTPELVGFQRFVIGAYDKRFTWQQWADGRYRPENMGAATAPSLPGILEAA